MITTTQVTLDTQAGAYKGYLAQPATEVDGRPAVLLLPEIYNLNGWIREVAAIYASRGHVALVPDLFWRQEPGVDLPYTPEGQQRGRALNRALDRNQSVADLLVAADWLRHRTQSRSPIAAVGFCLGGELALLSTVGAAGNQKTGIDAAVAYYPTCLELRLDEMSRLDAPSLIHLGEKDWRTPPDLVQSLRQVLPAGNELHIYPEADHAFGRFGHPPYHQPSADLAQERTFAWIDRLTPGH